MLCLNLAIMLWRLKPEPLHTVRRFWLLQWIIIMVIYFSLHSYRHSHSIWFVKNAQNIQTLLSNGYKKNTRTMDIGVTCSLVLKQLLVTIEELRKYCLFKLWWCVKAKICCFCRTKLIQYFRPYNLKRVRKTHGIVIEFRLCCLYHKTVSYTHLTLPTILLV